MSKRQTQSVSPLARKRDPSTVTQSAASLIGEMAESDSQNQTSHNSQNGPTANNNDDQSIVSLLKIILENQHHQAPPFAINQCPPTNGPNCCCHCHQMLPNHCQNQMPSESSHHFKANSTAISDESSLKSLLIAMLKNQAQSNYAQPCYHDSSYFRQVSSIQPCQLHANFCQHHIQKPPLGQVPSSATASTATKKEDHDDPSTKSLLITILKNQTRMNAQLENILQTQELIMRRIESQPATTLFPIPNRITFKKIDSVEECHEFEDKLKSPEFTQNMIKHFESICGGNSDLYGDNVAYALIDHVFTRRLFTLVTWTGLSRGTESKESFLKFERIFQFFFDLIRRVDPGYSIKSLKDFFQKIISNSKRRFEHKRRRISRVKLSSGLIVKRKKRPSMPDKETINNYVRLNSNVDREQEIISDEITDNDDDFKDNISIYSIECNTDEVATNLDVNFIKAEDVED